MEALRARSRASSKPTPSYSLFSKPASSPPRPVDRTPPPVPRRRAPTLPRLTLLRPPLVPPPALRPGVRRCGLFLRPFDGAERRLRVAFLPVDFFDALRFFVAMTAFVANRVPRR